MRRALAWLMLLPLATLALGVMVTFVYALGPYAAIDAPEAGGDGWRWGVVLEVTAWSLLTLIVVLGALLLANVGAKLLEREKR